jgi:hypothetical protein
VSTQRWQEGRLGVDGGVGGVCSRHAGKKGCWMMRRNQSAQSGHHVITTTLHHFTSPSLRGCSPADSGSNPPTGGRSTGGWREGIFYPPLVISFFQINTDISDNSRRGWWFPRPRLWPFGWFFLRPDQPRSKDPRFVGAGRFPRFGASELSLTG